MKKSAIIIPILLLAIIFTAPISASAASSAGIKPGSVFYFFDTTFEKIGLFFTFGPEKKARKALEYADERLAEAEAVANENKPKAVEKAMAIYQVNISLATEKSKEIEDKEKSEELLNTVSENTAKHQETLAKVLEKVPNEAKEAILKAIEVSKRGQEEAMKQIEELKKEVTELKAKNEAWTKEIEEIKKQKSENTSAPNNKPQASPVSETTQTPESKTLPPPLVPIVVDICKNIEGTQTTIPAGMRWDNNQNCVSPELNVQPTSIVDLCNNIEGTQSYVPSGMERDTNGNCIVPPAPVPTPTPTPVPVITPATPIIPSIIVPYINRPDVLNIGDTVEFVATVKDQNGNGLPDQIVIFENNYGNSNRVLTGVTNQNGVARVSVTFENQNKPDVYMKVLIPDTTNIFIQTTGKIY